MASGDFVVDVHGDPENAELQQSDAKKTPVYRIHRRYRPGLGARTRDALDDSRSDRRYFFAFADKSGGGVRSAKPFPTDDDALVDFVPIPDDAADKMTDAEETWVAQSRQLNERVRLQPTDVPGWWALVQLQDAIPGLTKAARLEKKIAILRAAVAANGASEGLWLALIRCSAQSGADVAPIWDQALHASPSAFMFERFVRAALSSFSQFSIGAVRARLQHLLSSLAAVDGKLHVMSLWNWAERSAGYDERSTAFCQAAVEFHLCCPEALRTAPWPARVRAFEQFWESEVARVGEPGAPTWAGWYGRGGGFAAPGAEAAAPAATGLRQWFESEARIRRRLPLRGADDDDDLERVVIFEDVRPTLFDCDASTVAVHLVDELLATIGVVDTCLTRARIVSLGDDAVSFRLAELGALYEAAPLQRARIPAALPDLYTQQVPPGDDCLAAMAVAVIDQVIGAACLTAADTAALRTTKIVIEARYLGPERAAKSVKAMLKRDRANVELCHALALVQSDAAASIYRSVLGLLPDWSPPVYCLAWAAVQHAFDRDDDLRPWLVLAGDGRLPPDPVTPIQLSRARNAIANKLARLGDDAAWWQLPFATLFPAAPGLALALLAVHLEYICADLNDALAFFHGVVRPILPPGGPQLDYVWTRIARLLCVHARRHPASCPPRLTRTVFESALESCPLSLPIWDAFVETAPSLGAVRTMFDACIARLRHDGLYDVPIRLFLYAIVFELAQTTSGRVHRLFEQALSENGRGVILLWRLYLRYEIVRGDLASARKIVYRAVDQCPGARAIWFDSICALIAAAPATGPGALHDNDLLELLTLMGEKGIRLHLQPPSI